MAHQFILNPISREFFSTKIVSPPVSMEPSKYLYPKIKPTPILLPSEPPQFGSACNLFLLAIHLFLFSHSMNNIFSNFAIVFGLVPFLRSSYSFFLFFVPYYFFLYNSHISPRQILL